MMTESRKRRESQALLEAPPEHPLFQPLNASPFPAWPWLLGCVPVIFIETFWPFVYLIPSVKGHFSEVDVLKGIGFYWALQLPSLLIIIISVLALRKRARLDFSIGSMAIALGIASGLLCHLVQVGSTHLAMTLKGVGSQVPWYVMLIDPYQAYLQSMFIHAGGGKPDMTTYYIVTFFVETSDWIFTLVLAFIGERYIRSIIPDSTIDQRCVYLGILGASTMFAQSAFWFQSQIGAVALGRLTAVDMIVTFFAENGNWDLVMFIIVAVNPRFESRVSNIILLWIRKSWISWLLVLIFEIQFFAYSMFIHDNFVLWQKYLAQLSLAVPLAGFIGIFFIRRSIVIKSLAGLNPFPTLPPTPDAPLSSIL